MNTLKRLLATVAVIGALVAPAHAETQRTDIPGDYNTIKPGEVAKINKLLQTDQVLVTCSGHIHNNRGGTLKISCIAPQGQESYDLDLGLLSRQDLDWIAKTCGWKGTCRVQAIAQDSTTEDDTLDAVSVLHVTNKPVFSWE